MCDTFRVRYERDKDNSHGPENCKAYDQIETCVGASSQQGRPFRQRQKFRDATHPERVPEIACTMRSFCGAHLCAPGSRMKKLLLEVLTVY